MVWLKKILIPNRYDCLYVVLGVLVFLAVASAFMGHCTIDPVFQFAGSFALLTAVGVVFVAIGAVIGLGRPAWRRTAILGLSAAALPPLALLGYYWLGTNQTILKALVPLHEYLSTRQVRGREPFEMLGRIYAGLFAVPFISGLLFFAIRVWPRRVWNFGAGRFQITRPRLLIGIAIILAVLGIGSNILRAVFPSVGNVIANLPIGIIATTLSFIIYVMIIYLPTRFLVGYQRGWVKVLVSILGLGLASLFFFLLGPSVNSGEFAQMLCSVPGFVFYLVCLSAVLDPAKRLRGGARENSPPVDPMRKEPRIPSIWCTAIALLLITVILLPFRYDLIALAVSQNWESARNESMLRWNSKGQIRRTIGWGNGLIFDFDETTDPNVMSLLNGNAISQFWFVELSTRVDFSKLERKPVPLTLQLDGGEITTRQLNDLFSQPASFVRFMGSNVVENGTRIDPVFIDFLYFVGYADGAGFGSGNLKIAKVLAAFETFENVKRITIQESIQSPELWAQVIRASQYSKITLWMGLPSNPTKEQMAQANENIQLSGAFVHSSQQVLTRNQRDWLDLSSMEFVLYVDSDLGNSQFFHDLVLAYPNRFQLMLDSLIGLAEISNVANFVFETNATGEPTGLYLPMGELNDQVETMMELKVLSFDECWILRRDNGAPRSVVDLSRLTKLEHLAFSSTSSLDRIDFLSRMKSLKYLQIPVVARSTQPPLGFDSCPSLEAITMFGKPDVLSVNEFTRLPKLAKLTIVDLFGEFSDPETGPPVDDGGSGFQSRDEYIAELKQRLPNTEIVIVNEGDFSPTLPESFKRYRDEKHKASLEKLHGETAEPIED